MRARHPARIEFFFHDAAPTESDSGTRRNAGGGNGWGGEATSPGTSLAGTGRSPTGKRGTPLGRAGMKRCPILGPPAPAGGGAPPRRHGEKTPAGGPPRRP